MTLNTQWYSSAVSHGGLDWLLLLPSPDWSAPVTVRHYWARSLVERATGLETRRPEQAAMRLRLRYETLLEGGDAQALRALLGGLGEQRVLVPIWSDARAGADWANRGYDAQVNVAVTVNASGAVTAATLFASGDSLPVGATYYAPLLAGRLQRTEANLVTPKALIHEVDVVEDAPWAFRVTPKAAAPGSWQWPINWGASAKESTRDLLQKIDLGSGREVPLQGAAVQKWRQKGSVLCTRTEWPTLLAYWGARSADQATLTWASLATPGAEVPQAPHSFDGTAAKGKMRLEDVLEVRWQTPEIATAQIGVEQVPDAVTAQTAPARTRLIKLAARVEGVETGAIYLTTWDQPITVLDQTWQSMSGKLEVSRLRQSLRPQNEEVTLTYRIGDIPLLDKAARNELDCPLELTTWDCVLSDPIATYPRFRGELSKPELDGLKARLGFSLFGGILEAQLPRIERTNDCNYTLFEGGCSLRNPSGMARAAWLWTGEYKDYWPDGKLLLENIVAPAEILTAEERLLGYPFGSPDYAGSYPPRNAFDGDTGTFYASAAPAAHVGIYLDRYWRLTKIRFRPRTGYTARLNGAKIQASQGHAWTTPVDLHTIAAALPEGWTEVTIADTNSYDSVRLLSAGGQNCDVAELEVYGRLTLKPANVPGNYFAGGWVVTGTGVDRQVREVRESYTVPGEIHLMLKKPFRGDVSAATFEFWPGCDGSWHTCITKFGNKDAFGGAPHKPDYVEEAAQNFKTGGK